MTGRFTLMLFRRTDRAGSASAPSTEAIFAEIDALTAENRARRDPELERRLVSLRHQAGRALAAAGDRGDWVEPDLGALPPETPPQIRADELTPELLRAGILRDGCVLVRGLIDPADAEAMRDEIDRAFRARQANGNGAEPGLYEEFEGSPEDAAGMFARKWVADGGLWAADSPRVMFSMAEALERNGLRDLIARYLGERPTISVQKCTLRKVAPDTGSAWHQDGAFLGDVRALNLWLALSHCGDVAPGLDIIPRRLDHIVATGTEGAAFDWSVAPDVAQQTAGETPILRPVFEPGDALFFDDLFLHATGADPSMTEPRYALESWFFAPSGFPSEYVPIAI